MGIILKYLLKNISEKKFRTFIIVISVTLCAALFFASNSISGTMRVMYESQIKAQTGKTDIMIHGNNDSPSHYFKINSSALEGVKHVVGEVSTRGNFKLSPSDSNKLHTKAITMHIRGFDLADIELLNPLNFRAHGTGVDFQDNFIILGAIFADEYGYGVGDKIDLEIMGVLRRLTVWGIAQPTGIFKPNPQSDSVTCIMPKDAVASLLNVRGRVNTAYVIADEGADILSLKEALESIYPQYTVREPFLSDEIEEALKMIVVPFFLMTAVVLFISSFIIFSTFKVITVERLPIIGTFRSIGATKKMTDLILTGESLTYGVLGGVLGNILGLVILYGMTMIMSADPWSGPMDVQIQYTHLSMVLTFMLAIFVAMGSSWVPILKVSKIPIKDLVLNNIDGKVSKKRWKLLLGVFFLVFSLIGTRIAPKSLTFLVSVAAQLCSTVSIVILIPYITKFILLLFQRFYGIFFGNEGILALKNLNDNKNIINNIALLAIGISALLMINTITHSVGVEVISAYGDFQFDIWFNVRDADRNAEQMIRATEGVQGTYGYFNTWDGIKVKNTDYNIWTLQGVDISKHRDYFRFRTDVDPGALLLELDQGRNIIVANMMKDRLELNIGDVINLEMKTGDKAYTVVGFYDSLMANGSNALISDKYYKMDMKKVYFDTIAVKAGRDPETVLNSLKAKFKNRGVWGSTIASMEQRNLDSNNQLLIILQGFSVLAMVIGIFGVFNNYMISFLERKRSIAIMKSVGLSKKQTLKMIMVESLTGGLIGGIIGIIGGFLMLNGVPDLMKAVNVPLMIHYKGAFVISCLGGGILIAVIASISPALKTSKLNIIQEIKYE